MPKKKSIPVKLLANEFNSGLFIGKYLSHDYDPQQMEETDYSHRHDFHIFGLLEKGTASFEIDFETHKMKAYSLLYINPNQVHRVLKIENVSLYLLAIDTEYLNPRYMTLLEEISPTLPLQLTPASFSVMAEAASLCIKLSERKQGQLYTALLKEGCNTLIGLVISEYLARCNKPARSSRADTITKAFRSLLERNFISARRPADYAGSLNISASYLNECIRNATGYSVSHHIQQRIVLEAKRLLCHSDSSVKEIAAALGYEDYAYFSRMFAKVTGTTALAFRNKNPD